MKLYWDRKSLFSLFFDILEAFKMHIEQHNVIITSFSENNYNSITHKIPPGRYEVSDIDKNLDNMVKANVLLILAEGNQE